MKGVLKKRQQTKNNIKGKKNFCETRRLLRSAYFCDSYESQRQYKEGEGGFEHVIYRSHHLNVNQYAKTSLVLRSAY